MPARLSRFVIVALLIVGVSVSVACARRIVWKPADTLPVSLRQALALAEEELESQQGVYHCVGASLAKNFSDGDWLFQFASSDGDTVWVNVDSDRDVKLSREGFNY